MASHVTVWITLYSGMHIKSLYGPQVHGHVSIFGWESDSIECIAIATYLYDYHCLHACLPQVEFLNAWKVRKAIM